MQKMRLTRHQALRIAIWAILVFGLVCGTWAEDKIPKPPTEQVDRIVVEKSARTMTLRRDGKVLKTYKVALSREPVGAKEREGDHRVPEGQYVIDSKNSASRFHLALHVSYPNAADRERARKLASSLGEISKSTDSTASTPG